MMKINFQDALQTTTAPKASLGQEAQTPDGRIWRYVQDSSAGMTKGHVAIPAAVTAVATTISSSTNASSQIVYITKASAGWTVGAFANGWGLIDLGTVTGQHFRIRTNTTDTLILYPEYALGTALSTDSTMSIYTPYVVRKAVVTTKISNAQGIAQVTFAASEYGWVLRFGPGVVIAGEVLTVGGSFVTGDDTAGEVVKGTTAKGEFDEQTLGRCLVANSAADLGALVDVDIQ